MGKPGKTHVLLMGQTPPPWHGQAVATQILFEHDWPEFEVHRLRMEFSEEMDEVGRFRFRKLRHLWDQIRDARAVLRAHPGCILFYPPASAKWVPFLRDVIFLNAVRHLAGATVFIYHASGLPVFAERGPVRRLLARSAYRDAEVSLEVSKEKVPPHAVFEARSWNWCPCAIEVPAIARPPRPAGAPLEMLFVGSLQEGKGVLEVLRTAALLKGKGREGDFRFRVVGKWFSEEFEEEARRLQRELGVEEMVDFVGQLTGDEKWRAYADADVFFFPTHYASEATPIVLMEALGMGMPIVSTQWAGIPAMLEGCETCRLLPVRSPEAYAAAMEELFAERDRFGEIDRATRALYRERFLPERFIGRVADAFREVTQDRMAVPAPKGPRALHVMAYLADQNPKLGRSLGISRMTEVVLGSIAGREDVDLGAVVSKSSIDAPEAASMVFRMPWSTRGPVLRVLTDNLHPLVSIPGRRPDVWYFPKGFMPRFQLGCSPAVATIHDTIIQFYQDHYPKWRLEAEYKYWASMLRGTLEEAAAVMTVSENAKRQIEEFISRHGLPEKEIYVTYEPCLYESLPQPQDPAKADYALHLGSKEPHKRTEWLVREWARRSQADPKLPKLHIVGSVPDTVAELAQDSAAIVRLPFLEDEALVSQFTAAKALLFPSEVEGFGLPAIEAYYLGTPVCFQTETSVEEVLSGVTRKGGFRHGDADGLFRALDEVTAMSPEEVRDCGLELREIYSSAKVVERMLEVFRRVAGRD